MLPFPACPVSAQGVSKWGERNAAHVSRELQGEQAYGVRRMCKFFAATSSSILKAPKAPKNYSVLCSCGQNLPVLFSVLTAAEMPQHWSQSPKAQSTIPQHLQTRWQQLGQLIQPWEHPITSLCVFTTERFVKSAKIQTVVLETAKAESDKHPELCRVAHRCPEVRDESWKHLSHGQLCRGWGCHWGQQARISLGAAGKTTGIAWDRSPDRGTDSQQCTDISWGQCVTRIWGTAAPGPMGALGTLQLTRDVHREKEQSLPLTSVKSRTVNFS